MPTGSDMPVETSTCWILVSDAAAGKAESREVFARMYQPVIRAYLVARWRNVHLNGSVDDALQDVFVELFRCGGALEKANPEQGSEFRAYLLGVVRNIACRHEQQAWKGQLERFNLATPVDDTSCATAFDRAWARALLKEAGRVHAARAKEKGERAVRRFELLRLRFQEGLPVREIAKLWREPDDQLHRQLSSAKKEFKSALRTVVAFQRPGSSDAQIDQACSELLLLFK